MRGHFGKGAGAALERAERAWGRASEALADAAARLPFPPALSSAGLTTSVVTRLLERVREAALAVGDGALATLLGRGAEVAERQVAHAREQRAGVAQREIAHAQRQIVLARRGQRGLDGAQAVELGQGGLAHALQQAGDHGGGEAGARIWRAPG